MPPLPGQRPTVTAGQPATETIEPPRQPLQPAHPEAPNQPVLVADALTGTPVWIYPTTPTPPPPPRVDPWAQRILAAGAASPLIGWSGSLFFGAMAGATTAIGYGAVCVAGAVVLRKGGKGNGVNVKVRIDNRN
ncbi:hypothetical protein ACIQVR_40935 [Streptomyces xanthochromogenes]|uniref:hypothetical protein n=1 Tax=Streptomyces xanthochromogenes TaxID=67384 RepID=UPI003828FC68